MEKINLKTATKDVREACRSQVHRLKKKGYSYSEISLTLGISIGTVKRYGGREGTKEIKRGRKPFIQQKMDQDQQKLIMKLIADKTPDKYLLPFALWTRKAICLLVKERFGITISDQTMGKYLRSWGFTVQKALLKSYEQKPEDVKKWLNGEYPKIKKEAAENNAEIYWCDETGVRNDDQRCRGFSPKGETPILTLNGQRFRINMISAVNNKGKFAFMVYEQNMNVGLLIKFLVKLHQSAGKKIVVILDNLKVHHAKILQSWLNKEEIKKRIIVKYLPSYSPELNPDEYLNCDLKAEINRRPPARSQDGIKHKVVECIEKIAANPQRIASYFNHHKINYAAI
jgi:transposase